MPSSRNWEENRMEESLKVNWIDLLTLIVAVATFFVSLLTYIYTRNRQKKHIKSLIKSKQAQLEELEGWSQIGVSESVIGRMRGTSSKLKADIEQLKEEL